MWGSKEENHSEKKSIGISGTEVLLSSDGDEDVFSGSFWKEIKVSGFLLSQATCASEEDIDVWICGLDLSHLFFK